jgi:hypothetical protein
VVVAVLEAAVDSAESAVVLPVESAAVLEAGTLFIYVSHHATEI